MKKLNKQGFSHIEAILVLVVVVAIVAVGGYVLAHKNKAHAASGSYKNVTLSASNLNDTDKVTGAVQVCKSFDTPPKTPNNQQSWDIWSYFTFNLSKNSKNKNGGTYDAFIADSTVNKISGNTVTAGGNVYKLTENPNTPVLSSGFTQTIYLRDLMRNKNNYIFVAGKLSTSNKPLKWIGLGHSLGLPICPGGNSSGFTSDSSKS